MDTLGWVMAGAGWLIVVAMAVACFRACRDDGDHTPAGNMARVLAFMLGMVLITLAGMPLADLAQHVL